jgi:hypothetical protein
MIISFNFYYAKPGNEDAVLRQRLRACDVRDSIGVPRGRVLARTAGAADLPDVIWEHHFEDISGHHADMAARAASPEFEAIRAGMRKLYRRFERPLFEICGAAGAAPESDIVLLDWIFCQPDNDAVARKLQGGPSDGRLLRLITPGNDLPGFVRQQGGSIAAPLEVDVSVQRVERSAWKVI